MELKTLHPHSWLFPFHRINNLLLLNNLPSNMLHQLVPHPLHLKMQRLIRISKLILTHPWFWRILGFVSSMAAFTCFALSPSFYDLFGRWNLPGGVIYSVLSLILTTSMLFVKKCRRFSGSVMVKAHVGFLVMMLTSLCSIWQDLVSQKEKGSYGRVLNMCSFGAFGLMSLSLSRQLQLGFEVGISNFLFGSFLVLMMKMNFKLAPLAAILCYLIINIRSLSGFFMEKLGRAHSTDSVPLEDTESGSLTIDSQPMNVPRHHPHQDQLAEYAKKSGMSRPTYHIVVIGDERPPYLFESAVCVGGMVYKPRNVFSTLEDAQENIAKLAFKYIMTGVRDTGICDILEESYYYYHEEETLRHLNS